MISLTEMAGFIYPLQDGITTIIHEDAIESDGKISLT